MLLLWENNITLSLLAFYIQIKCRITYLLCLHHLEYLPKLRVLSGSYDDALKNTGEKQEKRALTKDHTYMHSTLFVIYLLLLHLQVGLKVCLLFCFSSTSSSSVCLFCGYLGRQQNNRIKPN